MKKKRGEEEEEEEEEMYGILWFCMEIICVWITMGLCRY